MYLQHTQYWVPVYHLLGSTQLSMINHAYCVHTQIQPAPEQHNISPNLPVPATRARNSIIISNLYTTLPKFTSDRNQYQISTPNPFFTNKTHHWACSTKLVIVAVSHKAELPSGTRQHKRCRSLRRPGGNQPSA